MKKGFTLLISVLVVSIMLAVSLGVSNIIRTEIILANTGRQSQVAFYAADAGVECAIYWDTVHKDTVQLPGPNRDYDEADPSPFGVSSQLANPIECGDDDINDVVWVGGWPSCSPSACPSDPPPEQVGISTFTVKFENNSCARVTVTKSLNVDDPANPVPEAFIHADGFSDQNCDSNSPRVFQRSLETTTYE